MKYFLFVAIIGLTIWNISLTLQMKENARHIQDQGLTVYGDHREYMSATSNSIQQLESRIELLCRYNDLAC